MIICKWCFSRCVKAGRQKNGNQKYRCTHCGKHRQEMYHYLAYESRIHEQFSRFFNMGSGVRRMAGFLGISINTLQKWIGKAKYLSPVIVLPVNGEYDVDEIQTYTGTRMNKIWITYGWHISRHEAIGLQVGGRSSQDLKVVVDEVLRNAPKTINTDNYSGYPCLIAKNIHRKGKRKANHIERNHRNLRKDIACLIRETMCFSKRPEMLEARIRWYFWGKTDPYFFLKK